MKKNIFSFLACLCCGCVSADRHGAVCFTFDDFGGSGWVEACKIFEKYDAHASFFISGEIDAERIRVMKKLQSCGHSVGLHTINHSNAVLLQDRTFDEYFAAEIKPQLDVCNANGIKIRSFAYPNNRHSAETDAYLFKYFDYLRVGYGSERKVIYVPVDETSSGMLLRGGGIGVYYNSRFEDLGAILDKAAAENMLVVFFSHNIEPGAIGVHMPTELLEQLLAYAAKKQMKIIGVEEIPSLTIKNR